MPPTSSNGERRLVLAQPSGNTTEPERAEDLIGSDAPGETPSSNGKAKLGHDDLVTSVVAPAQVENLGSTVESKKAGSDAGT